MIDQILSLPAIYSGPEEVIVVAKVHPSPGMSIERLSRAMDDLAHQDPGCAAVVADVFIDISSGCVEYGPRASSAPE